MGYYKRKSTVVDAVQFTDPDNPPRGVKIDSIGYYVTTTQEQDVCVGVGEWIVMEKDGLHFYPIADDVFRELYEEDNWL